MIKNPELIEKTSFEIIGKEITVDVKKEHIPTIYRVIHTTADFEYAEITEISDDALTSSMDALKRGCRIYADTNMIKAGVSSIRLSKYGSEIYTLVADSSVAEEAKSRGVTRSIVGMERACMDSSTGIFMIGNAPTALFTLKKFIDEGKVKPALVIAVPVGFVGAAESKEEFLEADVPRIVTRGRKGGSTVAVAILNSIIIQMES